MRVLMVTTEYPNPENPGSGIFVARQAEALRAAGVEVDVLDFRSRANPLAHVRAWLRMRQKLAEHRYDVVHAQFGHSALVARAQRRAPVVVTYRGEDLQGIIGPDGQPAWKGYVLIGLCQLLGLVVDEAIVVSERMARRLLRHPSHVIPSGLDLERFRPLDRAEARIVGLLEQALESPSLLHGDLWGGNYMCDEQGEPCLIDPAAYYGHREADLAMTRLFGGFDANFYRAYKETLPLAPGHAERLPVYQLYHLLNHLNLFGTSYYRQCQSILQRFA